MADTAFAGRAVRPVLRIAAPLAAGLAFALGQAPFDLWPLALAGLVAAVWLIPRSATPRAAFAAAWLFGLGYFGLSMAWIVEPFLIDAAVTGWMAPFALAGLSGGLALLWGLPAWATLRLGRPVALVPLWALAELARAYLLTGFPWGLAGYVWTPTPAAQWASVIGPHGLTLATFALAALAAAIPDRGARPAAAALALFALLWGGGLALRPAPFDPEGRPVVRLVQPNAPQDEKWRRENAATFFWRQIDATAAAPRPDLVVWPETAVPMLLHNAEEALAVIDEAAAGTPVVLGIQREEEGRWYNSALLLAPGAEIAALYDKHHLVPFGEYMPAAWLFRQINVSGLAARAAGGYSPGPGPRLLDLGPLGTALPLICYEAVFPQDVGGAPSRPALLLQLTNDAWFGTWSGPYQHLAQARMRAIEQGLPLLRAANTGVSAVIDGAGRVTGALELGQHGHLDRALPPPLPPTLYSRSGDWPALVIIIAAFAMTLLRRRAVRH
ncbi:apolipoprotein N-acyltransferase [Roseivivax sp. CAU 1761]